jgi:hypothetical protein
MATYSTIYPRLGPSSNNRSFVVSGILLLMFSTFTLSHTNEPAPASVPKVEISGTQMMQFTSSICHQDYVLDISLPQSYGDPTKTFPVLYLLDAQWDFPFFQGFCGQQYKDGFVPRMVIEGITWGRNQSGLP